MTRASNDRPELLQCVQRQGNEFLGRPLSESKTEIDFAGLNYPVRQMEESSGAPHRLRPLP